MYDQQQGYYQYGQPINPAYNPGYSPAYNPNMQPNPFNNPYPPQPMPIYVLIFLEKEASPAAIIIDNNPNDLGCPFCRDKTQTVLMKKPGTVTYLWCCCLLWFTGILCCIPFIVDSCQDSHLICVRCNNAKRVIRANFCWLSLQNIEVFDVFAYGVAKSKALATVNYFIWRKHFIS